MDNWIIGTKLFILLYCIIKYVSGGMKGGAVVLLLILLCISINMAYYVIKEENIKKLFLVLTLLLLLISAFTVNMLFVLLVPICCAELLGRFSDDMKLIVIPIGIFSFFIGGELLPEYFLTAFFGLCMYLVSSRAFKRIGILSKEMDSLREKNDALYRKLDLGVEYEEQLKYLSQMEERNSLAQNIHDKVGHAIAGSLIQLEAASVIMDKDPQKANDIIRNAINVLKEGMENIRSTLRNIKPAAEQLGINRLKVILDEFSANSGIKASLNYSGNLSGILHVNWRIIMDNTKEALTNILKYSSASAVGIKLEVLNKLIRVEIRDNGVGAVSFKKGLGLRGMEERVENAGGNVIIDGTAGFSIIMLFPTREVNNENKSVDSR